MVKEAHSYRYRRFWFGGSTALGATPRLNQVLPNIVAPGEAVELIVEACSDKVTHAPIEMRPVGKGLNQLKPKDVSRPMLIRRSADRMRRKCESQWICRRRNRRCGALPGALTGR